MASSSLGAILYPIKLPQGVITMSSFYSKKEKGKVMVVTEMLVISESESSSPCESDSESFIIVEETN